MDDRIFDAIVLGLGAMGSATLYQLSLRGTAVLGIDQFKPPHEFGSSHGDTRITRIACGEGPEYSVFARRSHEIWRELERKTGRHLLTQNGLLVISGEGKRSTGHGIPGFLQTTIKAAEAAKVPYETMTGAEAKRRFPAFNLRDDDTAYFDKVGGFVRPEACVQTQLELAEANGAVVRTNEAVLGFEQRDAFVQVKTTQATYTARRLVVAAGSWLPGLLAATERTPFTVRRQVLYWFRAQDGSFDSFRPENFPVYVWQLPAPQGIYGFPAVGAADEGIKLATAQYVDATTPQSVDRTVSAAEIRGDVRNLCRAVLSGADAGAAQDQGLPLHLRRRRSLHHRPPSRPRSHHHCVTLLRSWLQAFRGNRRRACANGARREGDHARRSAGRHVEVLVDEFVAVSG